MAAALIVLASSFAGGATGAPSAGAQEDGRPRRERVARASSRAHPPPSRRDRARRREPAARDAAAAVVGAAPPGSVSIGRHNTGRLLHGRELVDSEHVRLKHRDGDQHHGTDELVALIERAAAAVAEQFPGSRLTVGDLSRRRGGRFRPHRSHRSGRDADVGFFITNAAGELQYVDRFYDFRADGTTRASPEWRFDDARNWAFVAAMVGQDEVPVQYVFVARWLKQRLLDHAAAIGAPAELIERATAVLDQPSRGGRHEDHFHVRIYCPREDLPRCQDDPPFHAWVSRPSREELARLRDEERGRARSGGRVSRRERERTAARSRRRPPERGVARAGRGAGGETSPTEEVPGG